MHIDEVIEDVLATARGQMKAIQDILARADKRKTKTDDRMARIRMRSFSDQLGAPYRGRN